MSRTMFAPSLVQQGSSLALPSLLFGTNSFAGPESIMNYPTGLLSRTPPDLTSRFMADRMSVPPGLTPFGLRPELHHHQHLHQHMHQHLMPPPPHPPGPSSSSSIDSAAAAAAVGVSNPGTGFGSAAASSLDGDRCINLLGMAGYSTLGAGSSPLPGLPGPRHGPSLALPSSLALPLVGGPLGLPLTSGLSGAFQPKNDVNSVPSLLMSGVQDRLSSAPQSRAKKSGQWCTAHVRIAWEIHLHQQNEKQLQSDVQRIGANSKGFESNRSNDHLLNLPTADGGHLPGHLESLYRLGVPLFGRSPYSACPSTRNPMSLLPFGGLGGNIHRLTGQPDPAGGFVGAPSDWWRMNKSTPFPCPPSLWLRAPEGTNRERERERERERDKDDEGQSKLSSAQDTSENNRERESISRRSSGSSRNERMRSRSPLRPGRKTSSSRESASSPGGASSGAPRPVSDRSESRDSDARRHAHRARHTASTSPAATTAPTPPFPTGQIYPARSESGLFVPYLWTNPLDGDHLMRRLLGNADDALLKADRLAHLDLMFGKIPPPLPGGLGLPFRHLQSPGRLGKTGLSTLIPSRFPIADSTPSSFYKVMGDGHHAEFR